MTTITALAFHAEQLHDDQVWGRVERVARWTAQRGVKATYFIYPFRARVKGRDITDRVRALETLGHEIGQHTHFYAGTRIDKPDKLNDLSDANVIHCLERDFETLCRMGVSPKGFAAGAWVLNDMILDTLARLGFVYDCSARFPKPTGTTDSPYHRWLRTPQYFTTPQTRLLCLPTTCSLGEWFKWGRGVKTEGRSGYRLVYLHDYDLLVLKHYLAIWFFLMMAGKAPVVPVLALAQSVLTEGSA